jgi:hypothetical protein
LAIIEVCQRLVVQAGVAMRAVPRVFAILYHKLEATTVIPAASSVRWWLQRLGLYALREPLPRQSLTLTAVLSAHQGEVKKMVSR